MFESLVVAVGAARDAAIAAHAEEWTVLSVDKLHTAIDYWVDRVHPGAVRRAENTGRGRCRCASGHQRLRTRLDRRLGLRSGRRADQRPASMPWPPGGPAAGAPGYVLNGGGALVPAPIVADKLAGIATLRPVVHPGDAAPEKRPIPSAVLA